VAQGVDAVVVRTPFEDFTVRVQRGGARPEGEGLELARWAASQFRFGIDRRDPGVVQAARELVRLLDGNGFGFGRGLALPDDGFGFTSRLSSPFDAREPLATPFGGIAGRLEEELVAGRLVVEREKIASLTERRDPFQPELPPLPPARRESTTTTFEVRFVDEVGKAISGIDAEFTADGAQTRATNAAGVALLEGVQSSSASVAILDPDALSKLLDPRWEKFRPGKPPKESNTTEVVFRGAELGPFDLKAELPNTVVIKPPLGELFVELWEKTGRVRHANSAYQITGPQSFEGTTDEDGRLLHEDVFPGDYTLALEVDVNRPRTPIGPGEEPRPHEPKIEEHSAPLVALEPEESEPQVRMIGVLPRVVMARMRGMLFDTNKCFLLPTAIESLKRIREIYEANNPSDLLVVGHTDTTADAAINGPLSVERAKSLKAYLEDDVDTWLKNYDLPGKKKWGTREDRLMIIAMPDFTTEQESEDPVEWFQSTRGLTVDGIAGPKTRTQLITEYMALDGVKLGDQNHFHLNISTHGAGENFPLDATGLELDQAAADGREDPVDRRVELFFFDTEFGVEPPAGSPDGPEYLEWRARAQETEDHEVAGVRNVATLLPISAAHFRTGSAVLLPEGEAPTTDVGTATTSVGALAVALRFNQENPGQKLLVAGHTDTVGSDASNDKLSTQRAHGVHAVLTGDRDAFVDIADQASKVSDWKQILRWASVDLAVLFPLTASDDTGPPPGPVSAQFSFAGCDPDQIDDNAFTGIGPVKAFQRAFNANKATLESTADELEVDGAFGKQSWGAVFDCYQYNMARELGEDPNGVQALRDLLAFLPTKQPFVGFGEHHPVDGNTADNSESQPNRRVEVLFFAKGQEPNVVLIDEAPDITELYLPDAYLMKEIPQRPGGAKQHPLFAVSLLDVDGSQLVRAEGIHYTVSQDGEVLADDVSQDGFGQFRVPPDVTSNVQVTWQPDADGPIFSRTIALSGALQTGGSAVEDTRLVALGYPFAEGAAQQRIDAVQAFQRDFVLGNTAVTAGALPPEVSARLVQAFEADFEAPIPPPIEADDTDDTIDIDDDDELPTLAADDSSLLA
jgi:outer membrane protein OmpA-like peptidoglycan-associated protein